jgi:hypothetical protein
MSMAGSITVRALEGGVTARPVGSAGFHADAGLPSSASEPAVPADISTPEPLELNEASVLLDASMPRNVAVLMVLPHATERDRWAFSLQGVSNTEGIAGFGPTEPRPQPDVVLADLAKDISPQDTTQPSQILGIMEEFSLENREVRWWVDKLRVATKDDLYLLILDFTGFEIPWELFPLAGENDSGAYLGTAVSTARWQEIRDAKTAEDLQARSMHEELTGNVAAFVDKELAEGGKEKQVLTQLHAIFEEDLKGLTNRLARSEAGFGLIYLACHGQWADTPVNYALGSVDPLVLSTLQAKKLKLFDHSKVIVFINACHSGRMLRDKIRLRTETLRGFPQVFLSKGAVGVIGTTGAVNDIYAAEMADWLLSELCTAKEPEPVSKLLRRWRAKVLQDLPPECSEQDYVPLLNACMYVYYGNPQSRLRITKGPS